METVSRDGESRDVERSEMERVGPREEERLEMERVTRDVERLRGGRRSCTARQSLAPGVDVECSPMSALRGSDL